jgi:hypothetical protein
MVIPHLREGGILAQRVFVSTAKARIRQLRFFDRGLYRTRAAHAGMRVRDIGYALVEA